MPVLDAPPTQTLIAAAAALGIGQPRPAEGASTAAHAHRHPLFDYPAVGKHRFAFGEPAVLFEYIQRILPQNQDSKN